MATQVARQRVATPERWQKVLARAIEQGIEVFVSAADGQRFATSATHLDTLYPVDAYACACPAGVAGDPVCMHRAAVRAILGWIVFDPAVTETPASVDCGICHGKGWAYVETHGGAGVPDRVACYRCGGEGRIAGTIVRQAAPAPVLNTAAAD